MAKNNKEKKLKKEKRPINKKHRRILYLITLIVCVVIFYFTYKYAYDFGFKGASDLKPDINIENKQQNE